MMRDLHLDFHLDFETPDEQSDSEEILLRVLGINCLLDYIFLKRHPETPALYDSNIIYTPPDQADGRQPLTRGQLKKLIAVLREVGFDPETALMVIRMRRGIEIFLDAPALFRRGKGDCNELAPLRVAESWRAGVMATPYLTKEPKPDGKGIAYHCVVAYPDGSIEDPSLILGMGGPERADDRREEIRKNAERWGNYVTAARYLVDEGADPQVLGHRIDQMGLAPKDGTFRSPYRLAA